MRRKKFDSRECLSFHSAIGPPNECGTPIFFQAEGYPRGKPPSFFHSLITTPACKTVTG